VKFTFIKESSGNPFEGEQAKVLMEMHGSTYTDVLLHFEDFLRGCGYIFDGHLDIVEEEAE
jgi:hypothetical protein